MRTAILIGAVWVLSSLCACAAIAWDSWRNRDRWLEDSREDEANMAGVDEIRRYQEDQYD